MEEITPRRESVLQRAADQLQDAIQSARRRSTSTYRDATTSLSLLIDSSSESSESDESDQENQAQRPNRTSSMSVEHLQNEIFPAKTISKLIGNQMFLRRQTISGEDSQKAIHQEKFCYSSVHPNRRASSVGDWYDKTGAVDVLETLSSPPLPPVQLFCDEAVEKSARKALEQLQQNVEQKARDNRATQAELNRSIYELHTFMTQLCGTDEEAMLPELDGDWTSNRIVQWVDSWKVAMERMTERIDFNKNMLKKERVAWENYSQLEREKWEQERRMLEQELISTKENLHCLQMSVEDTRCKRDRTLIRIQEENERLHMQVEDFGSTRDDIIAEPSATQREQHVLNVIARLKQAELSSLQWEMAYEAQLISCVELEERLGMLLEDHQPLFSIYSAAPSPSVGRRESILSTISSADSLASHRISLLEDQLEDAKSQIDCDHQQFLYEQRKWQVERNHLSHEVEEIQNVNAKVLKVLLLREKLLKRREGQFTAKYERAQRDRAELLQVIDRLVDEGAVALLYMQQLAMYPSPDKPLSIKPIRMKRLLKRLVMIQQEYRNHYQAVDSFMAASSVSRRSNSED